MKPLRILAIGLSVALLSTVRCFGLSGDATAELVNGVYVVTVGAGKEGTLQSSDATVANNSAVPLAKRGSGTLKAGDGFTGLNTDLRVEEGSLQVKNGSNLGTAAGCTVISNGAALVLYNTTPNSISFASESIMLAGRINNAGSNAHSNAFLGTLTIIDDAARIIGGGTLGFGGILALDGHTLGVNMNRNESFILKDAVMASGGTIVLEQGHFSLEGDNVISARNVCNLPHVEAASGGSLANEVFGYGGNVAALTKTGVGVFTFDNCLSVTGETYVAQGVLKLGGSAPGTAGLRAAVTNFANETAWLAFVGAANRDAVNADLFYKAATNLLTIGESQGFAETALKPNDAFRAWTTSEKYKMGVYRGYFWNNAATNKVCTFAASLADTEVLWVNGERLFCKYNSQRYNSSETYFVSVGEATLKPGPNEFVFMLGHYRTGSSGPKSCSYPQYGLIWAESSGLMYHEGSYVAGDYVDANDTVYHNVTNSIDFVRFEDSGDGSLLTLTKQPPAALAPAGATYVPRFDALRFGNDDADARGTLDLGGLVDFPQNGLAGCPCLTNGTLRLSGAWTFASADIAAHPLEVAADAGVTFDNATLAVSATGLPLGGTVILHAEPGATVTGAPAVSVENGRSTIWEIRREESAEGVDLILYGRKRGFVVEVR